MGLGAIVSDERLGVGLRPAVRPGVCGATTTAFSGPFRVGGSASRAELLMSLYVDFLIDIVEPLVNVSVTSL